jgi:hypothetical protein
LSVEWKAFRLRLKGLFAFEVTGGSADQE